MDAGTLSWDAVVVSGLETNPREENSGTLLAGGKVQTGEMNELEASRVRNDDLE